MTVEQAQQIIDLLTAVNASLRLQLNTFVLLYRITVIVIGVIWFTRFCIKGFRTGMN
jgi:hypothetical protein